MDDCRGVQCVVRPLVLEATMCDGPQVAVDEGDQAVESFGIAVRAGRQQPGKLAGVPVGPGCRGGGVTGIIGTLIGHRQPG